MGNTMDVELMLEIKTEIACRQTATVVLRGHRFAVSSGREEGYEVGTATLGQQNRLGEDVARLANRTDYVVFLLPASCFLPGRKVLHPVPSMIERRAEQVGHAGIKNQKMLLHAHLYI